VLVAAEVVLAVLVITETPIHRCHLKPEMVVMVSHHLLQEPL
jgi:hypothetical protein